MKSRTSMELHQLPRLKSRQLLSPFARSSFARLSFPFPRLAFFESVAVPAMVSLPRRSLHHVRQTETSSVRIRHIVQHGFNLLSRKSAQGCLQLPRFLFHADPAQLADQL